VSIGILTYEFIEWASFDINFHAITWFNFHACGPVDWHKCSMCNINRLPYSAYYALLSTSSLRNSHIYKYIR